MNTPFIIITSQRTGSTMLVRLLDSHQDVFCLGEMFFHKKESNYSYRTYIGDNYSRKISNVFNRASAVKEYLDEFYSQNNCGATGFKFMYGQARSFPPRFPSVLDYAKKNDIKIIHNIRSNYLRLLISRVSAKKSGVYRFDKNAEYQKIRLDVKCLLKAMDDIRQEVEVWERKLSSLNSLTVSYEDLIENRESTQKRVLDYLGVQWQQPLKADLVKITPQTLRDTIENIDEVADTLMGTRYEWCLSDSMSKVQQ